MERTKEEKASQIDEEEKEREMENDMSQALPVSEMGVVNMAYYVSLGFVTSGGSGESTNLVEVSKG